MAIPYAPSWLSGVGTYYTNYKIYIDKQGHGFSMASPPAGAFISQGKPPDLTEEQLAPIRQEYPQQQVSYTPTTYQGTNIPYGKKQTVSVTNLPEKDKILLETESNIRQADTTLQTAKVSQIEAKKNLSLIDTADKSWEERQDWLTKTINDLQSSAQHGGVFKYGEQTLGRSALIASLKKELEDVRKTRIGMMQSGNTVKAYIDDLNRKFQEIKDYRQSLLQYRNDLQTGEIYTKYGEYKQAPPVELSIAEKIAFAISGAEGGMTPRGYVSTPEDIIRQREAGMIAGGLGTGSALWDVNAPSWWNVERLEKYGPEAKLTATFGEIAEFVAAGPLTKKIISVARNFPRLKRVAGEWFWEAKATLPKEAKSILALEEEAGRRLIPIVGEIPKVEGIKGTTKIASSFGREAAQFFPIEEAEKLTVTQRIKGIKDLMGSFREVRAAQTAAGKYTVEAGLIQKAIDKSFKYGIEVPKEEIILSAIQKKGSVTGYRSVWNEVSNLIGDFRVYKRQQVGVSLSKTFRGTEIYTKLGDVKIPMANIKTEINYMGSLPKSPLVAKIPATIEMPKLPSIFTTEGGKHSSTLRQFFLGVEKKEFMKGFMSRFPGEVGKFRSFTAEIPKAATSLAKIKLAQMSIPISFALEEAPETSLMMPSLLTASKYAQSATQRQGMALISGLGMANIPASAQIIGTDTIQMPKLDLNLGVARPQKQLPLVRRGQINLPKLGQQNIPKLGQMQMPKLNMPSLTVEIPKQARLTRPRPLLPPPTKKPPTVKLPKFKPIRKGFKSQSLLEKIKVQKINWRKLI